MEWVRFFFGTPRRFLGTVIALGLITVVVFPGLLRVAVERLIAEASPIVPLAIWFAVILIAYRIIFAPFTRRGGRHQ